ncbi:AAA family ATPase [Burkholderia vietnamiensis]|uniref:AAA family ATPase n=1 Tax=Burkholderia vietnamiensis TaxID=60552 RepID=UPI001CF1698C|nr:AAA family ATPase [Burkholderia vietnamiensis]MCA8448946.1 AAA family ATPase [Burkholderia vietnamiensis]
MLNLITQTHANARVLGVSAAWTPAAKMANDLGIDVTTDVLLLDDLASGQRALTADHVLVLDEAQSDKIAEIQKAADAAGAKVIVVGDHRGLAMVH